MATNISFTNSGSTPQTGYVPSTNTNSSSPYGKALNSFKLNPGVLPKGQSTSPNTGPIKSVTYQYHPPQQGTNPGLISSGQVKGTEITAPSAPTIQSSYSGGQTVPLPGTPEYAASQALNTPAPTTNPTTNPTDTGTKTDTTSPYYQSVNEAQSKLNDVAATQAKEAALEQQIGVTKAGIEGDPNYSLDTQVGRAGLVDQNAGNILKGLAGEEAAQTTGANAALTKAGLLSPSNTTTQISPSSTLINSVTGEPIAGLSAPSSSGNTAYQTALKNAVDLIKNGQSDVASAASSLASYGVPNVANDIQTALGTGYNASQTTANQGTIGDLQTKINTIDSTLPALDSNFQVLQGLSQGFASNTPILNGITQLYGSTAEGNAKVQAFKAQLQTVRQQYQAITGADGTAAIPDNITPDQLAAVKQTMDATAKNNRKNYSDALNNLKGGSSSSSSSSVPNPWK